MNNLNGKTLKEFEAEQRRAQDSLQRAREQISRINREQEHREFNRIVGIGTAELPYSYDSDIFEYEFQRLKAKETAMLVDLNKYIYGGDTIKETNYFCPNCYSKIKKEYCFCPNCGQRLLWADIYDTRTTIEDNENVKKGE